MSDSNNNELANSENNQLANSQHRQPANHGGGHGGPILSPVDFVFRAVELYHAHERIQIEKEQVAAQREQVQVQRERIEVDKQQLAISQANLLVNRQQTDYYRQRVELATAAERREEDKYYWEKKQLFSDIVEAIFYDLPANKAGSRLLRNHAPSEALSFIWLYFHGENFEDVTDVTDLELGFVLCHADQTQIKGLVLTFVKEHFRGTLTEGSFDRHVKELIASILHQQEEAKAMEQIPNALHFKPEATLPVEEWRQGFNSGGFISDDVTSPWMLATRCRILNQCWVAIALGNIRLGMFGYISNALIAGARVDLFTMWDAALGLAIYRSIATEAGLDGEKVTASDVEKAFCRLYPHLWSAVRCHGKANASIYIPHLIAAYAVLHGSEDMFPFALPRLTYQGLDNLTIDGLYNSESLFRIAHLWAMQTQPDYKALTDALRPYYTPNFAKND
jgi:hypothetical protein